MGRYEGEHSTELSVAREPAGDFRLPDAVRDTPGDRPADRAPLQPGEREELLARIGRLEHELERYRAHAERTSKLFLSVASYADWVRDNARHDAELALRKARAKAVKLEATAVALEDAERELAARQGELERLRRLTDETRTRLSAFLSAGLDALNTDVERRPDLQQTLRERVTVTSQPPGSELGDP